MYRNKQLDRNSICIKVASKKYRWKKPGKNLKERGWVKNWVGYYTQTQNKTQNFLNQNLNPKSKNFLHTNPKKFWVQTSGLDPKSSCQKTDNPNPIVIRLIIISSLTRKN